MIESKKQKFFDVMLPLGRVKAVKVLPSEAACPFCGRHIWFAYSLGKKLVPAMGTGALIDLLPAHKVFWVEQLQIDECAECGAVCSI